MLKNKGFKYAVPFYFGAIRHIILYWLQWRPGLRGADWMEREFPECLCTYCSWFEIRPGPAVEDQRLSTLPESRSPDSEVLKTLTAKLHQRCPACNGTLLMSDTVKLDQQDGVLIPYHVHCLPSRSQS